MIKTRIFQFVGHIHNMQLCIEMISFINHENESILRWFYSFCEPRNFSLCPRSLVGVYSGGLGVWFMTFCCCLVEFGSSCFNHAWIESWFVWFGPWYSTVFQYLPISSNFAQPLNRSGPTFHRPQSTTWSTLCEGDVLHCMRQMVVTPDTDWFSDPPPPHTLSRQRRSAH